MSAAAAPTEAAQPEPVPATTAPAESGPAITSDDDVVPHLRVEVPECGADNPYEGFTKFIESVIKHMEDHVWSRDPDADIYPTLLPYLFKPPTPEPSDAFLTQLLYLLSIGMQGQVFQWKYKMLFEVHWNETKLGYMAELTSIRRVGVAERPVPVSEVAVSSPAPN